MLLDGVRVLSLCHYLQGPAAAQYLADMGADVVKVEPLAGAYERKWSGADVYVGGVSGFFLCANRNKRSVAVDLKSGDGRQAFLRLVSTADVVMENFRPGTMQRLGLGVATLRERKPDLIYASATGFGPDGPLAHLPGQDLLLQARSGLVCATGGQQSDLLPSAAGCAVVDQHGAALFAMGILAALYRKSRQGVGCVVESSLLNAAVDLQQESIANYANGRKTPDVFRRARNLSTWFHEAPYGIYRTQDGRHLALSLNALDALESAVNDALSKSGLPACRLSADTSGQARDRHANRDEIAVLLAERLAELPYAEIEKAFSAAGLWFAPVNTYSDLLEDAQARHNRIFATVRIGGDDAVLINHPNRYDGNVPGIRHVAERTGQDTAAVLGESGFAASEIDALFASGAVA